MDYVPKYYSCRKGVLGEMNYFQIYQDATNYWRWRLVASNGEKVASSGESFYSYSNAKRAVELVQRIAGTAPIA